MVLNEVDRRQEPFALQTVLVQILRRRVRRGDQRHAAPEQTLEQAGKDHRIGDVANEEFVQANHSRPLRQPLCDDLERLWAAGCATQLSMHLTHESIEVSALTPRKLQ
jgi:hypothetical protein